jgi:hypothetical protein
MPKKKTKNVIPICLYCGKKKHRGKLPKFCRAKESLMGILAKTLKTNQFNVFLGVKSGSIDIDAGTKALMKVMT